MIDDQSTVNLSTNAYSLPKLEVIVVDERFILSDTFSSFQGGGGGSRPAEAPSNEISGAGGTTEFQVLPGSLFNCPAPGFYPYETNCKEFYVCLEVLPNVLAAEQLYRCPERYLFDEDKRRCLREERVNCTRFEVNTFNLAKTNVLVVMERFLDQFFNTPLTYNRLY